MYYVPTLSLIEPVRAGAGRDYGWDGLSVVMSHSYRVITQQSIERAKGS